MSHQCLISTNVFISQLSAFGYLLQILPCQTYCITPYPILIDFACPILILNSDFIQLCCGYCISAGCFSGIGSCSDGWFFVDSFDS